MAARLTRLGPGHQPGPGQPRPHPGDQRDRHEPVEPAPVGPFHQDPGQGVPGGVDDRPAAVTGKGAHVTDPVQLHRPGGGRARHRELPPHPAMSVPPPGGDSPVGLDPGDQPRRHHHRVEQEQDQSPPQPRTTRPRLVTEAVMASQPPEPRRRRSGPGRCRAGPSRIRSCPAIRRRR